MTQQVPPGFEAAHAEWLRVGGDRIDLRPDLYRSQYWKLVKEAVLTSKGFKCCRCNGVASLVHHLNYNHIGKDHLHPETLAAVCRACHGLVEYARNAESLKSRISSRTSMCKKLLADKYNCSDENAIGVCTRLLEYRDELIKLRTLFETKTYYYNSKIKSPIEPEARATRFEEKRERYSAEAKQFVSVWDGNATQKIEKLIPLLELEIKNCNEFVREVFEPVLPNAGNLPSEVETDAAARPRERRPVKPKLEFGSTALGVESLVVGIKFHRGHVDGIAQGDGVELVREPNNDYDPNAIRVNLQSGETLGYLTRELAAVLAKQMDAGSSVQAQVSKIVRDKVYVSVTAGTTDS